MGRLRCVLFFVEQCLEPRQLAAHIGVDLQVARHNYLHLLHIVIYVTILRLLTLNILDQLALLCDHMGDFLEVLEMIGPELLLLFHNVVDFFVESKQVLVHNALTLIVCECHPEIVHFGLAMLRSLLKGASSRAWVSGTLCTASNISSGSCVGPFLCRHGSWILRGTTDSLGSSHVISRTDIICGWGYWVLWSSPARAFSLFSLQVVLTALSLVSNVLVNPGQRVRGSRLSVVVGA